MATKIRLQRNGRKGYAFYHIVVADSRAPRDGKFIERLGTYNPNTNPATIDLNFERALYWVQTGAQPTDTVRNLLSIEGVMLKKHLLEGAKKGAFSLEDADVKFNTWKQSKIASINTTKLSLNDAAKAVAKERLDVEIAYNKAKEAEIAKKQADIQAEINAAEAAKIAEKAVAEAAKAPVTEKPVAEEPVPAAEEATPVAE
jgi:small subunit ribosomal protein S16